MAMNRSLHWEQRVALIRHNLHAASRSGDFTFFRSLQAQGFVEGTNHVATLSATLGDEADAVLAGLDDLNASIAYMHQDAFRNVYNSLKTYYADDISSDQMIEKSKVYVDATMQKQMADHSIDKMTSSAIALIKQQNESVQDTAANVWITGNTIIADCVEICIRQIDMLEKNMSDFIRLEDSWETVKASVGLSTTALKGVYSLMAVDANYDGQISRPASAAFNFSGGNMLRRLSSAFAGGSAPTSRHSSFSSANTSMKRECLSPEYKTPNYLRNSVSSAVPTSLPPPTNRFSVTQLDTIPPTPAVFDEEINPFDTSVPLPPVPALHIPDSRVSQAVMVLM